jgi:hypothetical protein
MLQIHFTTHSIRFWMEWNFDGWTTKKLYPAAKELFSSLKGDFNDGRIAFEQNEITSGSGTIRLFEMLPHFAGRSTTESLYMQSTINAPYAFYFQSLISQNPSCPLPEFPCAKPDLKRADEYAKLLGISDLILITPKVRELAKGIPGLKLEKVAGPWAAYHFAEPIQYVSGLTEAPLIYEEKDYKAKFFEWFLDYHPLQKKWIAHTGDDPRADLSKISHDAWIMPPDCKPVVEVMLNSISLHTNCPGHVHVLKFSYNPGFVSETGEPLFVMSPGYIGIIPQSENLKLNYGFKKTWRVATAISEFSTLIFLGAAGFQLERKRRRKARMPRQL